MHIRYDRMPVIMRCVYVFTCLAVSLILIYYSPFPQAPLIGIAGIIYAYNQFVIILQTLGKVPTSIKYVAFTVDIISLILSSLFAFFSIINGYEPTLCKAFFASFILMLAGACFAAFDTKKRNGLYDELSIYAPPVLTVLAYIIGNTTLALIITGAFIVMIYYVTTRIIFSEEDHLEIRDGYDLISEFVLVATFRQVTNFCRDYEHEFFYEMEPIPADNYGFIHVKFNEHVPEKIKKKKIKAIQNAFNKKYPGFNLSIVHN